MEWEWIALVITGAILMGMEIYVPGFVLGTIGVVLQIMGVIWFAKSAPGDQILYVVVLTVLLDGATVWVAVRYFPSTGTGKKMVLQHTQEVYKPASSDTLQALVGKEGVTESRLRPTGMAMVDGRRVDVVTEGDFLDRGVKVKVHAIREGRLVVKKLS